MSHALSLSFDHVFIKTAFSHSSETLNFFTPLFDWLFLLDVIVPRDTVCCRGDVGTSGCPKLNALTFTCLIVAVYIILLLVFFCYQCKMSLPRSNAASPAASNISEKDSRKCSFAAVDLKLPLLKKIRLAFTFVVWFYLVVRQFIYSFLRSLVDPGESSSC